MELVFSGLRPRGPRRGAKDVGRAFVGKCLARFGSVGQCAVAHSLHALECPKEVRTLNFSFSFSRKSQWSSSPALGRSGGVCLDWSAQDG